MPTLLLIRLNGRLASRLDQLATALGRPRAWLIEQAITRYVREEAWRVTAITEALTAYRKGEASLRPHNEVMERLESKSRARTDDANPLA